MQSWTTSFAEEDARLQKDVFFFFASLASAGRTRRLFRKAGLSWRRGVYRGRLFAFGVAGAGSPSISDSSERSAPATRHLWGQAILRLSRRFAFAVATASRLAFAALPFGEPTSHEDREEDGLADASATFPERGPQLDLRSALPTSLQEKQEPSANATRRGWHARCE